MLIYAQHYAAYNEGRVPEPTPTYVAGFHQWLSLGRHVEKGQHGYGILAPVTARFASPNPADAGSWHRLARGEKPGSGETVQVEARSASSPPTSGTSPRPPATRSPSSPARTCSKARLPPASGTASPTRSPPCGFELRLVSSAAAIGGANGLTDFLSREVSIRMDMDDAAQVKTLAHELGHVLLHAPRENVHVHRRSPPTRPCTAASPRSKRSRSR